MDILVKGRDIYRHIQMCTKCGCVFRTSRDDATIWFEPSINKQIVKFECPSCFNLIDYIQERDELNVKFICRKEEKR